MLYHRKPSWGLDGRRARQVWWSGVLVVVLAGLGAGSARAQMPQPRQPHKTFMNKAEIVLPIVIDPRMRSELKEVILFVKDGPLQAWSQADRAMPTQEKFLFKAQKDGEYWFTVVTVDRLGRPSVTDMSKQPPQAIVVLDREAPQVDIRCLPPSPQGQCVVCKVFDANPDTTSLSFEYQTGDKVWRRLEPMFDRADTFCIPSQAVFSGMVRVTATDRCGNTGRKEMNLQDSANSLHVAGNLNGSNASESKSPAVLPPSLSQGASPALPRPTEQPLPPKTMTTQVHPIPTSVGNAGVVQVDSKQPDASPLKSGPVLGPELSPGGAPQPGSARMNPGKTGAAVATTPAVPESPAQPLNFKVNEILNHTHVVLNYQIENKGKSGVGKVEVWVTHDHGQSWQRLAEDPDRESPAEFELPGEGVYGLTVVATNGLGFGGDPPAPGDTPAWVVEVDLTAPKAELLDVRPIPGVQAGMMLVTWVASDKNMGHEPIDLYYAHSPKGPWQAMAHGLKNTGQYRWMAPSSVRGSVYVRMVVTDRAGNASEVQSTHAVQVDDLSRPNVRVIGVDHVTNGGSKGN
jgi:hypothetical protein